MAIIVNAGGAKVTAQNDAEFYAGMVGNGTVALTSGNGGYAEIVTNNLVRIHDGEFISQGRRFQVPAGEVDDFEIENGTQDTIRYDIIGYKFTRDADGNEIAENFVHKDVGVDGAMEEFSIRDGDIDGYIGIYKVKLNGLSIESVEPLYEVFSVNKGVAYIVEAGQNGNTQWIKYSDGTMIQWGMLTHSLIRLESADGSLRYGSKLSVSFAEKFVSAPIANVNMQHGNVALFVTLEATTVSGFTYWPYGVKAVSPTGAKTLWSAYGRWK